MARNVFILGAGASFDAGAPLMDNFLDRAEAILTYEEELFALGKSNQEFIKKDFNDVFNLISKLQIIHSKSFLDLYNIESLFSAIEMGVLINRLVEYKQEDIQRLRSSIINVIVKTLELSVRYPNIYKGGDLNDPSELLGIPMPYEQFIELLNILPGGSSILTFNYDVAIDYALHKWKPINYFLEDYDKDKEGYALLKLHGSINWGNCNQCNKIFPITFESYFKNDNLTYLDEKAPNNLLLMSDGLRTFTHSCNGGFLVGVDQTPIIVPPSWSKNHLSLTNVWRQAAKELSEAVNIFVIGYSLPDTDSFFRYLYALGAIGDKTIKNFWVLNPDQTGQVNTRFQQMIGGGIKKRYQYIPHVFINAINYIRSQKHIF